MHTAIIGVGLIGGSFAKDIKKLWPEATIYGIDSNPEHVQQALDLSIIDQKADYAVLAECDLVIVSIPVDILVVELPKILDA